VLAAALLCILIGGWTWARPGSASTSTPLLVFDTARPGGELPLGAIGLSMEAFELGSSHLRSEHRRLVRLMRLLGPSVLRIGGNSIDTSWWTASGEPHPSWANNIVTPADLLTLAGLLRATGWHAILGVDLGHFEPGRISQEARYARRILGGRLLGIELGNEPDDFGRKTMLRAPGYDASEYLREARTYARAVDAAGVKVIGPALGRTEWLSQLGAAESVFSQLTLHYYPSSTCTGLSDAAARAGGTELLAPGVREQEEATITALVHAGSLAGRQGRIGETNTAACPQSPAAGPVFSSALWALDLSLRAASQGVTGINFHSDLNACGSHSESPICAASPAAALAGDFEAQPEYYGLLAARQLEGGRFLVTSVHGPPLSKEVSVYATLARDGSVRVAIDDLALEGAAQQLALLVPAGQRVTVQRLSGELRVRGAPVSLGGVGVSAAGTWRPRPTTFTGAAGVVDVTVPPASAVILVLSPSGTA
jgi:hypothetical protein